MCTLWKQQQSGQIKTMDPINVITTSLQYDVQRLNTIANNAANVMTPGYKREFLANIGSFNTLMNQQAATPVLAALVDTKPGIQKQTSNPLDLSISDQGYFEVMTEYGPAYTRQGDFKLDSQGYLTSAQGHQVSGADGNAIYLANANPVIDGHGKVYVDDELIAQLKVISVDSPETLMKIGGGLFLPSPSSNLTVVEDPRVIQGALESSNVDSSHEMVQLIETYRHFEAGHKVIQAYDELNDNALRNLSQF